MTNFDSASPEIREAYDTGKWWGVWAERQRITSKLENYLEITVFSELSEGADPNPEWDLGFRAALALVKEEQK